MRHHVVRGPGGGSDRDSVWAVETAVTDPERPVRDQAARRVQRRDPNAEPADRAEVYGNSGCG